ncbi:hypothetical protein EVAR_98196_1 [Eumeta japonica]|uniref:Uncharacterized protein n=1 Tax=Eumeta variegata TaxID=151549 RepID=A0A4C1Y405_EUMVA|nr:hypothetical protein EVAR_98196_1 [Eumeta japonica]
MLMIDWLLKSALCVALLAPPRVVVMARGHTQDQSSPRANTLYDDADDIQRQLDNEAKERLRQLVRVHTSRDRHELRLLNFFVYRRDQVSPWGVTYRGTALLVRKDAIHGGLELPDFIAIRTIGSKDELHWNRAATDRGLSPPWLPLLLL